MRKLHFHCTFTHDVGVVVLNESVNDLGKMCRCKIRGTTSALNSARVSLDRFRQILPVSQ